MTSETCKLLSLLYLFQTVSYLFTAMTNPPASKPCFTGAGGGYVNWALQSKQKQSGNCLTRYRVWWLQQGIGRRGHGRSEMSPYTVR